MWGRIEAFVILVDTVISSDPMGKLLHSKDLRTISVTLSFPPQSDLFSVVSLYQN